LTTFSIGQRRREVLRDHPALFAAVYPGLDKLNIMHLSLARLRDPVRGHLQRAGHHRAGPALPAGVPVPAGQRDKMLRRNLDLRHRRTDRPLRRIKIIDLLISLIPGL